MIKSDTKMFKDIFYTKILGVGVKGLKLACIISNTENSKE